MSKHGTRVTGAYLILAALLWVPPVLAQGTAPAPAPAPAAPAAPPAPSQDTLGRDTPRGTLLGFMDASRNGRSEVATAYLNTPLRNRAAVDLAHKLFVVLDSRLPPRLTEVSDRPEGSRANPLKPDQDIIGTIPVGNGPLDIIVERVNRGGPGPVWLFSPRTLDAIPEAFDDVDLVSVDRFLPAFLKENRIAGIRLFEWLALVLVVPICFRLTAVLAWGARPLVRGWRRRRGQGSEVPTGALPGAVRLLLLAIAIHWLMAVIELPLLERQFWSAIAAMLAIAAGVWGLLLLNGAAERYALRHVQGAARGEVNAMLRLVRQFANVVVVVAGGLVILHYFGIDPTAALAGLGIGGIAVALAAQKTLENVIGGLSIILDKAVRVGDSLKLGDMSGTVDSIGLRSTRIRTLDRTILSVPNGQIANVNVETLSARDKFWFHHVIGLSYETTCAQMREVISAIGSCLANDPSVDRGDTVRVRFFRFGPFSLDVEIFAYLRCDNWEAFLETQQELMLEVMEIVERAGAVIALPSQTLHLANARDESPAVQRIGEARLARPPGPQPAAESA